MAERSEQVVQNMGSLLQDMAALNEAVRHHVDSKEKVKKQIAAAVRCMTSLLGLVAMKEEAVEADLHAIEVQESQQLTLAEASADALKEAIEQVRAAEIDAADLSEKVLQGVTTVRAVMGYSKVQGVKQLETLIKDVAALEQGLCQLQDSQEKVKTLLAASQADMITALEIVKQQEATGRFAALGEQESRRLTVAAANVAALERAFLQLRAAQTNGTALAEKVIKQVTATQAAMAATGTQGSQKITIAEENEAVLKRAIKALLAVQVNSVAVDDAVKEFTASAEAVVGTDGTQ